MMSELRVGVRPLASATVTLGVGARAEGHLAFPVTMEAQRGLTNDVEIIRPNATNIDSFSAPTRGGHAVGNLSSDGGWSYRVGSGDNRSIMVFDQRNAMVRMLQLEISRPEGLLLATRFVLEPGDLDYIVRPPIQCWNDVMTRLLPVAQTVAAAEQIAR